MAHFEEPKKFEIQSTIEQRPFENPAVQSFFTKWCEINNSIVPEVVDREMWEQKVLTSLLQKREDGKQTLYIPEDLQLWEMVGIMEAVDHDTFAEKPERQNEAKEKILELGYMLQDAAVYIAQRLDSISEGREIAGALAEEFYNYGQSLVSGEKPEEPTSIDSISQEELTDSENEAVDRFLAGDHLYESRRMRAEEDSLSEPDGEVDFFEEERLNTLAQFFRVSAKAFELEEKSGNGELEKSKTHLKTWENDTPFHSAFRGKIERAMVQKIETPKRELDSVIFRRGMEKLLTEMKEYGWKEGVNSLFKKIGVDLPVEQKKLVDVLNIKQLKLELETIRQSGNLAKMSGKEREIADKIQDAVSKFPFRDMANNPREMAANQFINCVGASTLGGTLLRETGLNYLVGDVPEHSVLFLVTSDGQVEWRDMRNALHNENLTNETIRGNKKDGSPITVDDITAFSKNPTPQGLMFDIEDEKYRDKLPWVKEGQRQFVTVFEPEYGQQIQILNTAGVTLLTLGLKETNPQKAEDYYRQAVVACRQAIALEPLAPYPYEGLGHALSALDQYEEAIPAYRQAIAIDPKSAHSYNALGNALRELNRGDEAILAYEKFIELADEKEDAYWIKQAQRNITELQNKKTK